jgi:hypothetical protein
MTVIVDTESGDRHRFPSAEAMEAWRTSTRPKGVLSVFTLQLITDGAGSSPAPVPSGSAA